MVVLSPTRPTRRRPRTTALARDWLPRLAVASVVINVCIVVTGGAVRLTGSGLGCPTWPRCTDDSFTNTPAYGIHGYIEFGNRLFNGVLVAIALATLVAAVLARDETGHRRRDPLLLSIALLLGIPAQAVIGGITVLTQLNPWVVMLHFLCSTVLVGLAAVLVRRTREGDAPPRRVGHPAMRPLALGALALSAGVLYLGAVVTGSGPHAGDAHAHRTGLDVAAMSQLHADAVLLLVGLSIAALVLARFPYAGSQPDEVARLRRAAGTVVAVEVAQGALGYLQYFTGVPPLLVALHMLGACLLVVAVVTLVLATRVRGPLPG
ncbi:MAG: COX15/CtaA family protein [Actinomycetales bacterium]